MRHNLDSEDDLKILEWITPIDYGPQHSNVLQRRQPGTGQWLLDSIEYKTWVHEGNQTLFCPGIPGAGKTILTSIVIEELTARFSNDPTVSIAYIYCDYRRQEEQKFESLIATLLKQLAMCQPSLPSSVRDLYDRHKAKRTRASLDEMLKTLQAVAILSSKVFIIVDALDECQVSSGCRSRLISEIFKLQAESGATFFTTSRPISDIVKEFNGCLSYEILAHDDDVRRYLDGHISQLGNTVLSTLKLQEEIKTEIVKAVKGMFLLARLYLNLLEDETTPKAIRYVLGRLHTQNHDSNEDKKFEVLSKAYEEAMTRITNQKRGFKQLALKVLPWIVCAKRPLTITELQHAIAVEEGDSEIDKDNFSRIEDIASACAGLVIVDEESNIMSLVHYTAQEYFQQTCVSWFPDAKSYIARTCLIYLSFDSFEAGFCPTDEDFEARLQSYPLYSYASHNWGHHARVALRDIKQLVLEFLESKAKVSASFQALEAWKFYPDQKFYSQFPQRGVTGIHLAAIFGLEEAIISLLENGYDVDIRNSFGRTPLFWAADRGNESMVKLLLEKGADPESKDGTGRTPLSWAAYRGHESVVKLLLNNGVNQESKDQSGRTPLSWAAQLGYESVVKVLLVKGANVESEDDFGRTPLFYTRLNEHRKVAEMLASMSSTIG